MAGARRLSDDQRRLLRLIALMPLASADDLSLVLDTPADRLYRRLARLRRGGWLASLRRGMSEPPRTRWFLTRRAVEWLYATDHAHPAPRERPRYEQAWPWPRAQARHRDQPPLELGHEHLGPETQTAGSLLAEPADGQHEHPPWTASGRGAQFCLRRLAALETIYQLAPALLHRGYLRVAGPPPPLSDFRLLRRSGFFVAVARYGDELWVPFSYAGLHASARILRRKHQHRFWDLDCYVARERRSFRISNRIFYEDPEQEVEPSALVVVAADRWAADLARRTLDEAAPTLVCTPERRCGRPLDARPSRDLISEPGARISLGRPERLARWLSQRPDLETLDRPAAYRLFLGLAEFPAMRAEALRELAGVSPRRASPILRGFLETGLAVRHDGRFYLAERGIRRAANLSRIQADVIRRRHGAYLQPRYRRHELRHNDAVNRLAVQFAREGARVFGGWRGELNIPGLTQLRPDLLLLVVAGPFGSGPYAIEVERSAVAPRAVGGQTQSLPPGRRGAAGRTGAVRLRDRARRPALRRRRRLPAPAGRQRGLRPGGAAHRRAHRLARSGSDGQPALPGLSGRRRSRPRLSRRRSRSGPDPVHAGRRRSGVLGLGRRQRDPTGRRLSS